MNARHPQDDTLIAYALNEMDPPSRAELEAHVRACPACSDTVRKLGEAMGGFRGAVLPDPPARVLVQLLSAQAEAREPRRVVSWWRAPLAAAVVVAFTASIFVAGFWFGQRSTEGSTAFSTSPAARARGRLPAAPQIAFQATPPMDAWLTSSGDSAAGWLAPGVDVRDSL